MHNVGGLKQKPYFSRFDNNNFFLFSILSKQFNLIKKQNVKKNRYINGKNLKVLKLELIKMGNEKQFVLSQKCLRNRCKFKLLVTKINDYLTITKCSSKFGNPSQNGK